MLTATDDMSLNEAAFSALPLGQNRGNVTKRVLSHKWRNAISRHLNDVRGPVGS